MPVYYHNPTHRFLGNSRVRINFDDYRGNHSYDPYAYEGATYWSAEAMAPYTLNYVLEYNDPVADFAITWGVSPTTQAVTVYDEINGQVVYSHPGASSQGNFISFEIPHQNPPVFEEYVEDSDEDYPEPEIIVDDGYSVEREEEIVSDIAPFLGAYNNREIPLISFEQEFVGNGGLVARRLHNEGFSRSSYVDGYHGSEGRTYHINDDDRPLCYVETDSSCGYEIIFDRLMLRHRSVANQVSQAQTMLRDLKDAKEIRLSARCGFHIHADIRGWGMKEIVSAYHLWNYIEDPFFRISSAFWNSHRDEEVGGDYSTPLPKGYSGRSGIGRTLQNYRGALNFSPFLGARGSCRCDAFLFEDWANCTCNLRQPTLEFRVFNATLNQRKIRAYLALCVGFINIARDKEHGENEFPAMTFLGTTGTRRFIPDLFDQTWEDASKRRVEYILEKFPLTEVEKQDILYCVRNSSLESLNL